MAGVARTLQDFLHVNEQFPAYVREDLLMKANNDVTGALRRTIGLMQGELERSVLSKQLQVFAWIQARIIAWRRL